MLETSWAVLKVRERESSGKVEWMLSTFYELLLLTFSCQIINCRIWVCLTLHNRYVKLLLTLLVALNKH